MVRDDLRVVAIRRKGFIRHYRFADVLHDLAVRQVVFCLISSRLGGVSITLIDLRVIGLLGCRAYRDPEKQARRENSGVKFINSHGT